MRFPRRAPEPQCNARIELNGNSFRCLDPIHPGNDVAHRIEIRWFDDGGLRWPSHTLTPEGVAKRNEVFDP